MDPSKRKPSKFKKFIGYFSSSSSHGSHQRHPQSNRNTGTQNLNPPDQQLNTSDRLQILRTVPIWDQPQYNTPIEYTRGYFSSESFDSLLRFESWYTQATQEERLRERQNAPRQYDGTRILTPVFPPFPYIPDPYELLASGGTPAEIRLYINMFKERLYEQGRSALVHQSSLTNQ